jgi:putative ABC transport system permease protein
MSQKENVTVKPIVAMNQVRLGPGRCLQLAISGMSYRLFRSLVTTAILALAAAFLVHMLGFGLLEQETQSRAQEETRYGRRLGQELSRFSQVDTEQAMQGALEANDPAFCQQYAAFSGATAEEFAAAKATANRLAQAARYFDDLATAPKAVIVGDATAEELFDRLAAAEAMKQFEGHLRQFSLPAPLDDVGAFKRLLLEERPTYRALLERIRQGHGRAIDALLAELKPLGHAEVGAAILAEPTTKLVAPFQKAGFGATEARLAELKEAAMRNRDQKSIEQLLSNASLLGAVSRREGLELNKVNFDSLAQSLTSASDAAWFVGKLREVGAPAVLTAERVERLFTSYRRDRLLSALVGDKPMEREPGLFGLSQRNQWLVILSFMVCMVGVANAMLMAVTERFTEIATMKCLGAMDRFVMMMFVFEALIQGAVGGLVGLLLGLLLAVLRAFAEFGQLLPLAAGASGTVGVAMLLSLVCTMLLAALSAVGPSYVAARLSPMEAMRVE